MGGFDPLSNTNWVPRRSRILRRAGVLSVRDFELGRLRWIPIVSRGDLREKQRWPPADLKLLMPGYNSYGVRMCSTRLLALSR